MVIRFEDIEVPMVWKEVAVAGAGGIPGTIFVDENAATKWVDGDLVITYSNTAVRGGLRFFDPDQPGLPPVWAQARILAVGGGGGGAHSAGADGGSGGGGSRYLDLTTADGGSGVAGQGYGGGACGGANYRGAGGGGAGGAGEDSKPDAPGGGGIGRSSNITGYSVMYAGGGGGAFVSASNGELGGAGGEGGGGTGAGVDATGTALAAENGVDGLGGGGGGGSSKAGATTPGGNGGSGIVIIRLSHFIVSQVPIPPPTDYTYDGNTHTGVVELFAYTFTTPESARIAKNADVYTVTAKIAADAPWEWVGGGRGERTVHWRINQLKVDVPTWNTDNPPRANYFVFGNSTRSDEEEKLAIDGTKWILRSNRTGYPGETCATTNAAGLELPYCTLTGHRETNAGEYHFTAALVTNDPQGNAATNFVWRNSGMGDVEVAWSILQAENEVKTLSLASWQEGTTNKLPSSTWQWSAATARYTNPDTVVYQWRLKGTEDWSDPKQTFDPPTAAGVYELKAYICKDSNHEPGNWTDAEKIIRFFIWRHPSKTLSDYVDIRPTGSAITTSLSALTDFPILVRLKEPVRDGTGAIIGGIPGFRYADVRRDGLDLRFVSISNLTAVAETDKDNPLARDTLLPFEIDTWNPQGESLVWVKVPKVWKGATFRMYWRIRKGTELLDDVLSEETWSDYAGVWHLSKQESDGSFADSSGNGLIATVQDGATVTFVESGRSGRGVYVEGGNIIVNGYNALNNTTDFMFSGWYRNDKRTANNTAFAGTKMGIVGNSWNVQPGWSFFMNTATKVGASSGNQWDNGVDFSNIATVFQHLAYVVPSGNNNRYSYYNGANQKNKTGNIGLNERPLQILGPKFSCDEVRLRKRAPSTNVGNNANWVKAEYETVNNPLYCTFGLVNQLQADGVTRAWVNWWSKEPWTTLRQTKGTEGGRYWRQPPNTPSLNPLSVTNDFGQLARVYSTTASEPYTSGIVGAVVGTYRKMPSGEVEPVFPTALGPYVIELTMVNMQSGTTGYPGQHVLFDGDRKIDIEIIEDRPTPIDPDGPEGATFSGRVLTANDDTNAAHAVALQSYWRERTDEHPALNPYWEHNGTAVPEELAGLNLRPFAGHALKAVSADGAATNVLWDLSNVYVGNMMTNDASVAGDNAVLSNRWNTLPWSPTSVAISAADVPFDHTEVGQLLMRNVVGAEIRSGVFTNGVGTVYFDAVNAYALADLDPASYQLVVEYAPAGSVTWTPVTLVPIKVTGATMTTNGLARTDVLSCLDVKNGGKVSSFAFYRVCAKIDRREPTRIRIRRVSTFMDEDFADDPDGFIAIDNVIVSWPTQSVRLESPGTYDPSKRGKRVLGMEKAFSVDYPTPYETDLTLTANYTGTLPREEIQSARCHYRWRYLNSRFEPELLVQAGKTNDAYDVIYFDKSTFKISEPFKLNGHVGDLEYWFDLTATVPYYSYVDYSGRDLGLKELYTEELSPNAESRFEAPGVLPSDGKDWFVRLREGHDPYGSVTLKLTDGPLAGDYPMYLAEDNTWKCHVLVPTRKGGADVEGTCGFYFQIDDTGEAFHPVDGRVEFPAKGSLAPGDQPTTFVIDHAATCLEFRFNDKYATFAAMRAEYQTFNEWHDAHSPLTKPAFFASAVDTNGVNLVNMQSYQAPIATWEVYGATNTAWEETFYLPSYSGRDPNDSFQPRDTVFPSHTTPNDWWDGTYIAFVQEVLGGTLAKTGSTYNPYPATSGMAGKLLGQGRGRLEYMRNSYKPDGLERITFKSRIGQSIDFESFAYSLPATAVRTKNYIFTALATMSHMINNNNNEVDMAAGGALSLVAYLQPLKGCYELRVERIEQGTRLMVSLWKWHCPNGMIEATCLVKRRMDSRQLWTNNSTWPNSKTETTATIDDAGPLNPQYRLMFISVETKGDCTEIYGGLSVDAQLPFKTTGVANYNAMANGYHGIYYKDTADDRFKFGAYGLGAKDCPGEFLLPRHADTPVQTLKLVNKNNNDYEFLVGRTDANARWFQQSENKSKDIGATADNLDWGDVEDIAGDEYGSLWALPPNRIDYCQNTWRGGDFPKYHQGLSIPPGLEQKVIVELQDTSKKSAWVGVATNTVRGYSFQPVDIPLYLKGQYNMRLTTGSEAIDVVVDDVKQTRWMGEDGSNPGRSDVFLYTQGHVVTNTAENRVEVELVPSRAHVDKALSIRSPVIDGLGKITFAYADADTNAEIWVQMATNAVASNLTGANGYNNSVKSVELGQQQQVGEWITLAKYSAAGGDDPELRLGKSGWKTVYVGLHDNKDKPLSGSFRLFIPTNVVAYTDTRTSRELDRGDKTYGKITITDLWVSDEPGLDARSWRGWNLRTVGDDRDTERRMYLADLVAENGDYGLVGALNNSLNDAIDKNTGQPDDEKTRMCYPTIWSPTRGSYTNEQGAATQAGVGEMTFKARLYGDDVEIAPAKVTLYGSEVGSLAERWDKIEEFEISTPYFTNISWKAGDKSYTALRLEVSDSSAKTRNPRQDRVILEEITICERVKPTLSFVYAWPFRTGLDNALPITDYGTREQQPLAGENWGVQTQLRLQQLGDEVDLSRGIEVFVAYTDVKPSAADWGYEQWADRAKGEVKLVQVGDASNLVFRSVGAVPESVLPPSAESGTVVQFMLKVTFHDKGGATYGDRLRVWTQPAWYHPVDYNKQYPGFSPYTILDTISPGRAWINEVNWNNGNRMLTHTEETVKDNQFVEVCIPSGVDMTDWRLRAYNMRGDAYEMAVFGRNGTESSKVSGESVNGYEFFVFESPLTDAAGGFVGPGGIGVRADGVWSSSDISGITAGAFAFAQPFAFELVRPSGVVEHTFTIDGTNEWGSIAYDATNLLAVLNRTDGSPKRFYAGREEEKNVNGSTPATKGTTYGSSGVTGERGSGVLAASGPGSEGTWTHGLDFTAGARNPGQEIPEGWFLAPNGTNTWVYFSVAGDHLSQKIGKGTNRTELVILPQGVSTNVIYTADPWWETATIAVDGVLKESHKPGRFDYRFSVPEGAGTIVRVVATEGVDARLDDDKFKLKGQRYRTAVLNWLGENWPDKDPNDIRFARMAQLATPEATHEMTLIDMYWLDICPFNTETDPKEANPFEAMDPPKSEWVLRAGFTEYAPNSIVRHKSWGDVTNSVFKVKMFITNEFDAVANPTYAPYTLQGIANERSCDGNYSGAWTSETFKINGFLDVNRDGGFNKGFLPFREFIFNQYSFAPAGSVAGTPTVPGDERTVGKAGTPGDFETVIELLDPFSSASAAGASYGWWRHPNDTPAFFSWRINHTNATPTTVEMLKPRSTYDQ